MPAWQIAIFAILALLATGIMAWPVWRGRRAASSRREAELAVCRAQLDEVKRDRALGLVDAEAARAAETEIKRRMLAIASQAEEAADPGGGKGLRSAALMAILLVPVAGAFLYARVGRPTLPDLPLAARHDLPSGEAQVASQEGDAALPSVEEMVAGLEERLKRRPDDVQGWLMLARSNVVLRRYEEAAKAYRRVRKLAPSLRGVDGALGEVLTIAAEGVVTPEAKRAFESELSRNPKDPRARFYLALAHEQAGEFEQALEGYVDLGRDSTSDAPWLPQLRARIKAVAGELGRDPQALLAEVGTGSGEDSVEQLSRRLASNPKDWKGWIRLARLQVARGDRDAALRSLERGRAAFSGAPFVLQQFAKAEQELGLAGTSGSKGPTEEDIAAAREMTPEQQQAMIASMVDRLAARLRQKPDDIKGWRMLARSYRVLGRREEAAAAYGRIAAQRPQDVEAQLDYALALLDTVSPGAPLPAAVEQAFEKVHALDKDQPDALYYLGLAAEQRGDRTAAQLYWTRLLALLPEGSPEHAEMQRRLAAIDASR